MRQTWRVSTSGRIGTLALPIVGLWILVRALIALGRDGWDLGLGYAVLFGLALILAAPLLAFRPSVTLDGTDVVIRNPLRTHRVALAEIVDIKPGWGGLRFQIRGGRPVTAWAVQKSNAASWSGRRTRADEIADAIRERTNATEPTAS